MGQIQNLIANGRWLDAKVYPCPLLTFRSDAESTNGFAIIERSCDLAMRSLLLLTQGRSRVALLLI